MTTNNSIYILVKGRSRNGVVTYEPDPIMASFDYNVISTYAKKLCRKLTSDGDYLFETFSGGDFVKDEDDYPLATWIGINYFAVGNLSLTKRVIFRIKKVPIMREFKDGE